MREPFARPTAPVPGPPRPVPRPPRSFEATDVPLAAPESLDDARPGAEAPARKPNWLLRLFLGTGGLLLSLALGLAINRLIGDLFALAPWLGTAGLALALLFGVALLLLLVREVAALLRLQALGAIRADATRAITDNHLPSAREVLARLEALYATRPDLARPRAALAADAALVLDAPDLVRLAEQHVMLPLDERARTLTAAAARRVALVTAVSPRALVDLLFVLYESLKLGRDIARLYGARPGLAGSLRLMGAILSHLAVTGGLVLTDGVVEQLLGQGVAARLSAKLGEGVVNALMTVRVGLAAARVLRPLPYAEGQPPGVRDFLPELANVLKRET